MKKIPIPCTQDCQNRTPTCKFDGTCGLYEKWKNDRSEILTAYYQDKRISNVALNYDTDKTIKYFKKRVRAKK